MKFKLWLEDMQNILLGYLKTFEPTAILVAADWLDENGEHDLAKYARTTYEYTNDSLSDDGHNANLKVATEIRKKFASEKISFYSNEVIGSNPTIRLTLKHGNVWDNNKPVDFDKLEHPQKNQLINALFFLKLQTLNSREGARKNLNQTFKRNDKQGSHYTELRDLLHSLSLIVSQWGVPAGLMVDRTPTPVAWTYSTCLNAERVLTSTLQTIQNLNAPDEEQTNFVYKAWDQLKRIHDSIQDVPDNQDMRIPRIKRLIEQITQLVKQILS